MTLADLGISDTILSFIHVVLNFFYFLVRIGFDFSVQIATWIYNIIQFMWRNFHWDNPFHLLVLSMILLLDVFAFLAMFGGSAAYGAGGFGDAYIGSGSVMSGLGSGDYGNLYAFGPGGGQGGGGGGGGGADGNETDDSEDQGDATNQTQDPELCGNSFCDSFATRAKVYDLEDSGVFSDCTDTLMIYDIPTYCISSGTKTYVWHQWSGDTIFKSAVCGLNQFYSLASNRCDYSNGSIWYVETPVNCIQDCNKTSCEIDLTCRDIPGNCLNMCCPAGSLGAYRCVDAGDVEALCNDPNAVYEPLERLRRVSNHCPCSGDSGCVGDYGGSTCCSMGTYHWNHCYTSLACNSTAS